MPLLNEIKKHPKSTRNIKRVGRGPGTGHGKTSGRGHKGQRQRGPGPRPGFEGGQMPLIRTIPKRGFTALAIVKYQVLNTKDLDHAAEQGCVDPSLLYQKRILRSLRQPVKILGDGPVSAAYQVKAQAFSRSAKEQIEKAGGACEIIPAASPRKVDRSA